MQIGVAHNTAPGLGLIFHFTLQRSGSCACTPPWCHCPHLIRSCYGCCSKFLFPLQLYNCQSSWKGCENCCCLPNYSDVSAAMIKYFADLICFLRKSGLDENIFHHLWEVSRTFMETIHQVRVKFSGLTLTNTSCKPHYACPERDEMSFNNPTNTIPVRNSGGMRLVTHWEFSSFHSLLLPEPTPPSLLLVLQHSLIIHRHIRATERAVEGNEALSPASRQICIQSSMLHFNLSTSHIHRCVCRFGCFRRKGHLWVRNSLGQCWDSSNHTSLLCPAYFLPQKQPGMKSFDLNSITKP